MAADSVQGTVGAYRMADSVSDPSTLCAYPVSGSRLKEFRARGPRVDFPSSVGQVGWVEWRTIVKRKTDAGTWKTIGQIDRIRRSVTVGFTTTFPTMMAWSPDGERLLALARSDSSPSPTARNSDIGFALVSLSTDGASADVLTRRGPGPWTGSTSRKCPGSQPRIGPSRVLVA